MSRPDTRQSAPPLCPLAAQAVRTSEKERWYADRSLWTTVAFTVATITLWVVTGVDAGYSAIIMCLILSTHLATPAGDRGGWKTVREVAIVAVLIVVGIVLVAPHGIGVTASDRVTQGTWGVIGGVAGLAVIATHRRITGRPRFHDTSSDPAGK